MDYSVTVYARKMSEHLQPLLAILASEKYLPYHFGFLDIPQDGTVRNMFLMQGPQIQYGKDKDDKRLFRATYMVRVMTEVIPEIFTAVPVTEIALDLGVYSDVRNLNSEELSANQALISTGLGIAWNVGLTQSPGSGGTMQPRAAMPIRRTHKFPPRRQVGETDHSSGLTMSRPGAYINETLSPLQQSGNNVEGRLLLRLPPAYNIGPTIPTFVSSFQQFTNLYGSLAQAGGGPSGAAMPLHYAVTAYFLNGGTGAYILRVANTDAVSATLALQDLTPSTPSALRPDGSSYGCRHGRCRPRDRR